MLDIKSIIQNRFVVGLFVTTLASVSLVNAAAPALQQVSPNVPVTSPISTTEGWINGETPLSKVALEFDQNITLTGSVLTHNNYEHSCFNDLRKWFNQPLR